MYLKVEIRLHFVTGICHILILKVQNTNPPAEGHLNLSLRVPAQMESRPPCEHEPGRGGQGGLHPCHRCSTGLAEHAHFKAAPRNWGPDWHPAPEEAENLVSETNPEKT